MKRFQDMGLPGLLVQTLQNMNFNEATPIQEQAIPLALQGKDVLGSAQTGTGKTGAFAIPLVAKLLSNNSSKALVMTPTRELAAQVMGQIESMLGKKSQINTALLIGGEPMFKQLSQLRRKPRIVVGTPGRINDHLNRGNLMLNTTDFLVLDETDRMLDMGFSIQIDEIMKYMTLQQRQTLLFSATFPKNIVKIAEKYLTDPVQIAVSPTSSPAENITQDIVKVKEADKYDHLISQLEQREGSVIVFVKTKYSTEKMAGRLSKEGHSANAIHGDLRQSKRDRVLAAFRKKRNRILVATDVAARGLDIPHIEHVINYDLPQCPEDYVHRIGRTARAGAKGFALNFVTPADRKRWDAIDRLLNPDAKRPGREQGQQSSRNKNRSSRKRRSNASSASSSSSSFSRRRRFGNRKDNNSSRRFA